jgi:hypothetical protein
MFNFNWQSAGTWVSLQRTPPAGFMLYILYMDTVTCMILHKTFRLIFGDRSCATCIYIHVQIVLKVQHDLPRLDHWCALVVSLPHMLSVPFNECIFLLFNFLLHLFPFVIFFPNVLPSTKLPVHCTAFCCLK